MTKKQTDKPKQRTKVKDLPRKEKELSKEEQKKVKGAKSEREFFHSLANKPT